jgi:hypothetical protein
LFFLASFAPSRDAFFCISQLGFNSISGEIRSSEIACIRQSCEQRIAAYVESRAPRRTHAAYDSLAASIPD